METQFSGFGDGNLQKQGFEGASAFGRRGSESTEFHKNLLKMQFSIGDLFGCEQRCAGKLRVVNKLVTLAVTNCFGIAIAN